MKKVFILLMLMVSVSGYGQLGLHSSAIIRHNSSTPDDSILYEQVIATRSGSYLLDTISGDTAATILLPSFNANGVRTILGSDTTNEKLFDSDYYTIFFRFEQLDSMTTGTSTFMRVGATTTTNKGLLLQAPGNTLKLYAATDATYKNDKNITTDINGDCWRKGIMSIRITCDSVNHLISAWMYNEAGTLIRTMTPISTAGWVYNSIKNAAAFSFTGVKFNVDGFKKYRGIKTYAQCIDDSDTTGLQIYLPLTVSGIDVANAKHFVKTSSSYAGFTKYRRSAITYPMDYGYTVYRNITIAGSNPTLLPLVAGNKINGDSVPMSLTQTGQGGWVPTREAAGISNLLNMVDCKIRFTNDFFDRSNVIIWNDLARDTTKNYLNNANYDAANPKDFHISELNQKEIYDMLNDGYRGRLYINMTPNSSVDSLGGFAYIRDADTLLSIVLLSQDVKHNSNKIMLDATRNSTPMVLTDGLPTYDANGYVQLGVLKTTVPMFTIRIDDGYKDAYTLWRGWMTARDIDPFFVICSKEVDTSLVTFCTWDDLNTLQDDGWQIGSHGTQQAQDWDVGQPFATIESELKESKDMITANLGQCDHITPCRYGQNNLCVMWYAKKHGFITCHSGTNYTTFGHGVNPITPDLFNFYGISLDLAPFDEGIWDLETGDTSVTIANVKAQLDLCVSGNRWAILYMHKYGTKLAAALSKVLEYAALRGIMNVTMDEALNNMSYQP